MIKALLFTLYTFIVTIGANYCPIIQDTCLNTIVCPKVTEVTVCSDGGIKGHTTYELSLVFNKGHENKNMYAVYGVERHPMIIPAAYQDTNYFGSNLGGINSQLLHINPPLKYDSWLTIGLSDGDPKHLISSVGIDFNMWNKDKSLIVDNGAIFIMNPVSNLKKNDEIIIAHLTIPTNTKSQMIVNIEGKTNYNILSSHVWKQGDVVFNLNKPIISTNIPTNCDIWFDGCNSCIILKNDPTTCTDMKCDIKSITKPGCLRYANGH